MHKKVKYYPDAANGKISIKALVMGSAEFVAIAYYEGREVGRAPCKNCGENADVTINLVEAHLWELGEGRLYDLKLIYGEDEVTSYFGLRSVQLDGMKFRLNGKAVCFYSAPASYYRMI